MIKEFNFDSLEKSILKRSSNSHKGDFGKVMVVWGNEQAIQDCINAHFKAGADQVVIQADRKSVV